MLVRRPSPRRRVPGVAATASETAPTAGTIARMYSLVGSLQVLLLLALLASVLPSATEYHDATRQTPARTLERQPGPPGLRADSTPRISSPTLNKTIHLLPWQVVGIGTPGRWSGNEWKDLRYCAPRVSGVATLAFQFQGPLAGPNRSVLDEWLAECKHEQMGAIYEVKQLLFDGHSLRANVTAVWKEAAEQLRPLVQAGSVMGAFLGDELLWGGLSYPDLVAAVRLVRGSFPPPFIIYANEALPVLQDDVNAKGQKVHYAKVPDGQDWLSIDFYSFRVHDSTNKSAESYYSRVLENVYKTNIYPKMSATQFAVLVPGSYAPLWPASCQHYNGCPAHTAADGCGTCCINPGYPWQNFSIADYDETMAKVAWEFWDWSQRDEKVVGIAPWHYYDDDCAGPYGVGFQSLPNTLLAYTKMAALIRQQGRAAAGNG
jgi:hypothetical protein